MFLAVWLSHPKAPYFQSTVVKRHIRVLIEHQGTGIVAIFVKKRTKPSLYVK